ncbi:MAG: PD40 domain-containing protein [Myxococcales bacterium]|nr:PD40 domain-containing protein [Myxococcales bacterium]
MDRRFARALLSTLLFCCLFGPSVRAEEKGPEGEKKRDNLAMGRTSLIVQPKHGMGARYPSLSPDGKRVAFSFQGDLWVSSADRSRVWRLTAHTAYEHRPRWSPDGQWVAFTSVRSGSADVYVVHVNGGSPKRLTWHQAHDEAVDWSPDGRWILFQSDRENVSSLYRVSVDGGLPQRLVGGFWNYTYNGAWSPDGGRLLFNAGMEGRYYWWRKGYRGPNNAEVFLYDLKTRQAKTLTSHEGSDLWPMWSADGRFVYFVSDRSGCANLWRISTKGGKAEAVTTFTTGPVRWPLIARNAHRIVYERDFRLWETQLSPDGDLKKSITQPLHLPLRSSSHTQATRYTTAKQVEGFAVSGDGKKIVYSMRGEVFVSDAAGKLGVRRLTHTTAWEHDLAWHPDNRHVLYVSDRGQGDAIYKRDAMLKGAETFVLQGKKKIRFLRYSPDGKHLFYLEGKDRLMLLSKGAKEPRLLSKVFLGGWTIAAAPVWAPDSKSILYNRMNQGRGDLYLQPIEKGKAAIRLTLTAAHDADGALTPDGKYLVYRSNRYGSDWFTRVGDDDLYVLPLKLEDAQFKEDKLDKLFAGDKKKKAAKPTSQPSTKQGKKKKKSKKATAKEKGKKAKDGKKGKKPVSVEVQLDGLADRARRLSSLQGSEGYPFPSPKGGHLVFFSNAHGGYSLWMGKFKDGKLSGAKPFAPQLRFPHLWSDYNFQWAPDGKHLYVLVRGKIARVAVPSGKVQMLSLQAEVDEVPGELYIRDFRTIWVVMRDEFYDAKMSGTDWKAIYHRYLEAVRFVQARQDWVDLMNEMLGELNASHLGVRDGKPLRGAYNTAALGARIVEDKDGFRLVGLLKLGPLRMLKKPVKEGSYLLAINGISLKKGENPYALLRNQIGKRLILSINEKPTSQGAKEIKIKPTHYRAERRLRYRAWVQERRKLVHQWSKGQIGYLHMRSMTTPDLFKFIRDFETELGPRKASIIDVRFNWGGNIHDRVLSFLERRLYGTWQIRGGETWRQPFFSVGRKPMVMLINEETLSDGEMTANGFRALRLGTLIGMPTYRWLIFTSGFGLYDGLMFRLPFWICKTLDGKDLEKVGVEPHIRVKNTLMDRLQGRDPQLRRAVDELLKQLSQKKK